MLLLKIIPSDELECIEIDLSTMHAVIVENTQEGKTNDKTKRYY